MAGLFDGSVVDCDEEDDPFREIGAVPEPIAEPLGDESPPDARLTSSPDPKVRSTGLVSDLMRADL